MRGLGRFFTYQEVSGNTFQIEDQYCSLYQFSPKLNPIERFWQWLKQSLKNQVFPSLQALRERVQELLEQLSFQQVSSVSDYNFILDALFYAALH
jgi:hypothetical protein